MGLQYFHDLVIVRDRSKPAVKAAEQKQVYFITLDSVNHFLKFRTFPHIFTGSFCSVDIYTDNHPALLPRVFFQTFLLCFQRKTFYLLFFTRNTYVKCNTKRTRRKFFFYHAISFLFLSAYATITMQTVCCIWYDYTKRCRNPGSVPAPPGFLFSNI